MGTQAFLYNAVIFNFSGLLTGFFGVGDSVAGLYLVPFGVANFLGALMLGRLFDTFGRRPDDHRHLLPRRGRNAGRRVLIAHTGASVGVFVGVICVTFFFASAAASSAYLTVSEIFPLETRAMAIALFYAIATGIGGCDRAALLRQGRRRRQPGRLFVAFAITAALMCIAASVEWMFGVRAEQKHLEDVAEPLSAESVEST